MKRKEPKSKEKLHDHFARRWMERTGEGTVPIDLIELAIKTQNSIPLERQSLARVFHGVKHRDTIWPVLYDNRYKAVVTVLPRDSYLFRKANGALL